jgi:hypothetical protein
MTSSVGQFYIGVDKPLQQGDILIGSVTRVASKDLHTSTQWFVLDSVSYQGLPAKSSFGGSTYPALVLVGGRELTMVTTHDCGLDKEFNVVLTQITNDNPRLNIDKVAKEIERREDLDRFFQVSPLINPKTIIIGGKLVDQENLMAGNIIGYLPIPEYRKNDQVIIPECVVDLSYRSTVDRLSFERRLSSISETARQSLRYALMKLDSLRTPSVMTQLNDIFGQSVVSARVSKKNPLLILLLFENGTNIELLRTSASPDSGGPSRSKRSTR